jgi:hypothetical protein
LLHVLTTSPRCMSLLHVRVVCTCCMPMPILQVLLHAHSEYLRNGNVKLDGIKRKWATKKVCPFRVKMEKAKPAHPCAM